jgi:hypothetical protein
MFGALVALAALLALPGSALAASTTADVYVVQGLVGTTADILIDDNNVAPSAAAKTVVGPLRLAAGSHVVTLKDGADTVVSAKFTVKGGTSSDVVAHRAADVSRMPVVTVFANDLTGVAPGKTRVVVSHTAVAPPADIRVDGTPLFRNVANGESLTLELPSAKTCTIDMVPTATSGPAILSPVVLSLKAGTLTRIFVIGDATAGDTDAVVQVLPVGVVGSQRPTSVKTGDGGQAADSFVGQGPWGLWLSVAALATFGGLTVLNRRSRRPLVVGSRHSR